MKDYKKYKWFHTSNKLIVAAGKSAESNDGLLKEMKRTRKDYWVMHTSHPGSPFSVIISDTEKVKERDLEECAVFTGCFSRAWKEGKKNTEVHYFKLSQLEKKKEMKTGTWGIAGNVKKMKVKLELFLIKQEGVLKAVPEKTAGGKGLLKICPGKTDKSKMTEKIAIELGDNINLNKEEILAALPAGGVKVC